MNFKMELLYPLILFCSATLLLVQGESDHVPTFDLTRGPLKCAGNPVKITHLSNATIGQLRTCTATNKSQPHQWNTEDRVCSLVCMAKTLGMLDSNGKVVREKVRGLIEVSVPVPSSKTLEIIAAINTCADKEESNFVEGNCTSYRNFFLCTIQKILKACGYNFPFSHEDGSDEDASE